MNCNKLLTAFVSATLAMAELPPGFDPAKWPGRIPSEASAQLSTLRRELTSALQSHDAARIKQTVAAIHNALGAYACTPDVQPVYGGPTETSQPDLEKIESICRRSFDSMKGRNGWELPRQQRLRTSFRNAESDLRAYEAGITGAKEFLQTATQGFDYIVSQQTSVGAFGYPYNPQAAAGSVEATMLRLVREGEKRGIKMTEGNWVIEDMDDGGLQFDNGEAGAGLLHAYAVTGDRKYLESSRRAADWAMGRKLVANWNYNSFSGWLLARLYRVTGERKYLDAAIEKFEIGVLPGQWRNGRWVDQHNARPQYHALMSRNLVEYCLALEQAQDPRAREARRRTELALDSLAEEINTYGASNSEEGLPLEALSVGLLAFGEKPEWQKAADIYANYLVNHLMPPLIETRKGRPETLSAYLLWRRMHSNSARA